MKKLLIIISFLNIILCSLIIHAQESKTSTKNSYTRARQTLERGIQVLGGLKNFQAVEDITYKSTSTSREIGQSMTPDSVYHIRPTEREGVIDLKGKRSYQLFKTTFLGSPLFRIITTTTEKSGFTADLDVNVAYPLATPAIATNNRTNQRTFPNLLLQTALSRAATLRWLGEENYEGRKQQIVIFSDSDGSQLTLYFDSQTGLLTKTEVLGDRFIDGLVATETVFSDYRDVNNVKIPFRVVAKSAGEITQDLTYTEIKFNSHPNNSLFEMPKNVEIGPETGGALREITLNKLAKDIYYVEPVSAGSVFFYSSMFVVFKDYVLVIEAPLSDGVSQAIIAKIKETAPGKPIKYLVPTHYHTDHMGGIRGYIAEGSTIVTTPGNQKFIEKLAAVSHPLNPDRLSLSPRPLSLETFKDKKVFSDGEHIVEFYNVGPTIHAEDMVIAYFPQEKIVFATDLLPANSKGNFGAASQITINFYDKLRQMGLQIETVANGHGRIDTMSSFQQSVTEAKKQSQLNK